jgi:Rieske Fe-S protein
MSDGHESVPQWKEDFPIEWERDHYITRRELAKFLTLGSVLLTAASWIIALVGRVRTPQPTSRVLVALASSIPRDGSLLFRYPTVEDPCILVRTSTGGLKAYSQTCTHLACAVIHRPKDDELFCPCHIGRFACDDGRALAGPPTRPLPRVRLEVVGDEVFAVGTEV